MTGKQGLHEFLRQKKAELGVIGNPKRVLKEWQEALCDLMTDLRAWLTREVSEGLVTEYPGQNHKIVEPELGKEYVVDDLVFLVPPTGDLVRVSPVARFAVGSEGRVDVVCGPRRASLVRSPERASDASSGKPCQRGKWYIASLPPASLKPKYVRLTEDSFADLLRELVS